MRVMVFMEKYRVGREAVCSVISGRSLLLLRRRGVCIEQRGEREGLTLGVAIWVWGGTIPCHVSQVPHAASARKAADIHIGTGAAAPVLCTSRALVCKMVW